MKKQTAVIAVMVMILNMFCAVPSYAASENTSRRSEAIAIVNGLGLAEKSDISEKTADSKITRAEFAGVAASLSGNVRSSFEPTFFDVQQETAFADEIYTLRDRNEMVGFSDIEFGTDEILTLEQATMVLLRVLGYAPVIKDGMWDMQTAVQRTDLYNGLHTSVLAELTKGDAALLVYNALTAPVCVRDYGSDGGFSVDNTRSILWDNLKIGIKSGIVSQSYFSSLTDGEPSLAENDVAIGGEIFSCVDYPDGRNYFGYSVECYYRENADGGNSAVFMLPKKNKAVTVNSEDFEGLNGRTFKYTSYSADYRTVEKTESLKIDDDADVVYNGVACPDYTDDDLLLKGRTGYITFIDNDNDGKYEAVMITECRDYVVDYVDSKNKTIYTKWQDNVDLSNADNLYIYNEQGKRIAFDAIFSSDIVTIQMSKDGKNAVIMKTNSVLETAVKSINYSKHRVTLDDDREYVVDDSLWAKIDDIRIGTYGMFYFDYRGRLAGLLFENYGSNEGYAFLSRIWCDRSDDTVYVKLFRMSGQMEQYTLKDKVTVDGDKIKAKKFYESIMLTDSTGTQYPNRQVIKFKASDNDGKIYFIDTPNKGVNETDESLIVKGYRNAVGWEAYGEGYLGHYVALASFTKAMSVPMPADGEPASVCNNFNDSDYYIIPWSSSKPGKNFDAFPINKAGIATMMVTYYKKHSSVTNYGGDESFESYKQKNSVMVNDISYGLFNEEPAYELEYYENNIKKTAFAIDEKILKKPVYTDDGTETGEYKDVVRGDVVRLSIASDGRITSLHVDCDVERKDNKMFFSANLDELNSSECGVVYAAGKTGIKILVNPITEGVYKPSEIYTDTWVSRMYSSTMQCTVYNREDNTVSEGSYVDAVGLKQNPDNPAIVFGRCSDVSYNQLFIIR